MRAGSAGGWMRVKGARPEISSDMSLMRGHGDRRRPVATVKRSRTSRPARRRPPFQESDPESITEDPDRPQRSRSRHRKRSAARPWDAGVAEGGLRRASDVSTTAFREADWVPSKREGRPSAGGSRASAACPHERRRSPGSVRGSLLDGTARGGPGPQSLAAPPTSCSRVQSWRSFDALTLEPP
jgi:hypothetical protein